MIESNHNPSLKQRLLDWMVNGGSVRSFARKHTDRHCSTYRRWASDPAFKAKVRERSTEISEAVARRLRAVGELSAAELAKLLQNEDPAIRLGAVRTALKAMTDIGRYVDLEARMAEVEAHIKAQQGQGDGR